MLAGQPAEDQQGDPAKGRQGALRPARDGRSLVNLNRQLQAVDAVAVDSSGWLRVAFTLRDIR